MERRHFDRWTRQSGYASLEVAWYAKQFTKAAGGRDGISFRQFFEVFMQAPPRDLRSGSNATVRAFVDKLMAAVLLRRRMEGLDERSSVGDM